MALFVTKCLKPWINTLIAAFWLTAVPEHFEHLEAKDAFALAQRFEFYYTPKSASWLNMIEIEFSALARQCLKRRIPAIKILRSQILAALKQRAKKKIKINWQFSIQTAGDLLAFHPHIHSASRDNMLPLLCQNPRYPPTFCP